MGIRLPPDMYPVPRGRFNPSTERFFQTLSDGLFIPDTSDESFIEAYTTSTVSKSSQDKDAWSEGNLDDAQPDTRHAARIVNISTETELDRHLANNTRLRAFFIRQTNSYSPLSVSQHLFDRLSSDLNIPRSFRDYILYYGDRQSEVEIAPPPAAFHIHHASDDMSETGWTLTSSLRFIEYKDRIDVSEPTSQWSLRQIAIFCNHNIVANEISWVLVTVSQALTDLLLERWALIADPMMLSPMQGFCHIYADAVSGWRPYLVACNEEITQHEVDAQGATPNDTGPVELAGLPDRTALLILENKLLAAKLAISAARADISFLRSQLAPDDQTKYDSGHKGDRYLASIQLRDAFRDLDMSILRIDQLHARLQGVTSLVTSFRELNNGYSLQLLAIESRKESEHMRRLNERMHILAEKGADDSQVMRKLNKRMHDLAEKNAEESATVTVLTILTLIYLPLTVISNFFSTSFVGTSLSTNRIFVTQDWWILFVLTVPLTAATLYVWWVWSRIKARRIYPAWWPRAWRQSETNESAVGLSQES